jgi:flagellar basal-body rod modification protein FlgD
MAINLDTYKELGLATVEKTKPKKQELGQEQFLKLMTTQLTNQDPTKPMENGDFLAQMAQFSTVSGIQDLQASFKEFANSISSDQALQASTLVGRSVLTNSNEALLGAGGEVAGQLELPASSAKVKINILNSNDDIVRQLDLGSQAQGTVKFSWDGLEGDGTFADPGVYKIQAETAIDGVNTRIPTQIRSQVESVTLANGRQGIRLNLAGLRSVNYNEIKQIL